MYKIYGEERVKKEKNGKRIVKVISFRNQTTCGLRYRAMGYVAFSDFELNKTCCVVSGIDFALDALLTHVRVLTSGDHNRSLLRTTGL